MARVLLVDDEVDSLSAASDLLQSAGHDVATANSLAAARSQLGSAMPDVLLLDLILPDGNGLELLDELSGRGPRKIVLITGHPGIKAHIANLSGPAVSFLTKPIDARDLAAAVRTGDDETLVGEGGNHFGLLVGEHETMRVVYQQIERVARTDTPVLIVGETGTGKELVATAIHRASGRMGQFVALNCGSLSGELAASELFGHEKGSFTGAVRRHVGAFKRADRGTLFLDELVEMPLNLQPHFLRAVETGTVQPVGSEQDETTAVRIVAATNRDPEKAVAEKYLRQDLYFRLSVFPIFMPPLRARRTDIPLLVRHFLKELRRGGAECAFSDESMQQLGAYHWPGNVRELKHVVQRTLIMCDPGTTKLELPAHFDSPFAGRATQQGLEAGRTIRDVERELIELTLAHFDGDKKAAAETLGISLNTLYNRLNSYREGEST